MIKHSAEGCCGLDGIELATYRAGNRVLGRYGDLRIDSHYQAIFSLAHRRPVGYEALMRASLPDGTPVSPAQVFAESDDEHSTIYLDRLCRDVHVRNFAAFNHTPGWLFLNVNPTVIIKGRKHGPYFSQLLQRHGTAPHQIVVEITEDDIEDEDLLDDAVNYYKQLGCLVAIDDFGAGHSNFDRIWRIQPDIVKLDRSMVAQAASNKMVRRVIPNLISLIHESGSLTLMEGVETNEEALVAMDSGIDFVQGYYFARPMACPVDSPAQARAIPELCATFRDFAEREQTRYRREITAYTEAFAASAATLANGEALAPASASILAQPRTQRCYVLDARGRQLSENVVAPGWEYSQDRRFLPLHDATGATWFRRHYFRRAITSPNQVHVSRPYLSITGANMCVTLSTSVTIAGELHVYCCDLDWQDP